MSEIRELAFRNIGRNVVHFQKMEGVLKTLLQYSNFSCPVIKMQETLDSRKKSFEKQSMGNLAKELYRLTGNRNENAQVVPEEIDEVWISMSFGIEGEQVFSKQQKAAISFLVSERNKLIHQLLPNFDLESEESCKELIVKLDEKNELIKSQYKNLHSLLGAVQSGNEQLMNAFIPLHEAIVQDLK